MVGCERMLVDHCQCQRAVSQISALLSKIQKKSLLIDQLQFSFHILLRKVLSFVQGTLLIKVAITFAMYVHPKHRMQ